MFLKSLNNCNYMLKSKLSLIYVFRNFSLWSMKKDPDLESALSRNRRWIVNNQIKNIILRYPNQVLPVKCLQKKFKSLDLQGNALNWLKKYPCCFEVFLENDDYYCQLTKRMMFLVEEEESVKEMQEPVLADRLAKLLMMSMNQRLNVVKINELKRNFGFPDDYLLRILPKHPDAFRLINHSGRKSSMEIQLLSWNPDLAVSAIEISAKKQGCEPCFTSSLPSTWITSWERFREFNSTPYVSPYLDSRSISEGSKEMEKRNVSLVHELVSLTLWKKLSIMKLSHFKREFNLPEKLNVFLLKHPGIFYVSNKYQIYTVLLREGYNGSELIGKDPLVMVKDKFGELMQEGLHEYNQRRRIVNLEKKKKKGLVSLSPQKRKESSTEMPEQDAAAADKLGGLFNSEERKRFYKVVMQAIAGSYIITPLLMTILICSQLRIYISHQIVVESITASSALLAFWIDKAIWKDFMLSSSSKWGRHVILQLNWLRCYSQAFRTKPVLDKDLAAVAEKMSCPISNESR